jgi:hypothetical protein
LKVFLEVINKQKALLNKAFVVTFEQKHRTYNIQEHFMHKILVTVVCGCFLAFSSTYANLHEPAQKKSSEQIALDDFAKELILRYPRMRRPPEPNAVEKVFGQCGNPCLIKENYGGFEFMFIDAAKETVEKRLPIIIDGECASGCAVFADAARPNVCITPRAFFEFHRARITLRTRVIYKGPQTQSKDVDDWVKRNGGYPKKTMTTMPFTEAKKFWPICNLTPPLPKSDPRKTTTATAE